MSRNISVQSVTLIFIVGLLSSGVRAETRVAKTMQDILSEVDQDTLVVFDVDNTLMRPATQVGSDQHYDLLEKQEIQALLTKNKGMTPADAKREGILEATGKWNALQEGLKMETVETGTARFVKNLQKRGIHVMGLTARAQEISDLTLKQLKGIGIELGKGASAVTEGGLEIPASELNGSEKAIYKQGFLFQGETNNKGEVLRKFLSKLGQKPKKIVFVDDKKSNVDKVERAFLTEAGIPHVEFQYEGGRARINAFLADPEAELKKTAEQLNEVRSAVPVEASPIDLAK